MLLRSPPSPNPRTVKFELPTMASSTPEVETWYIFPWSRFERVIVRIATFRSIQSAHSLATRFC